MIYFIEAIGADLVKIGFTDGEPEVRLKGLQTGSPHKLRIALTVPGERSHEAELHRMFADLREHGEWFRVEGELRLLLWLMPRLESDSRDTEARLAHLEDRDKVYYGWLFPKSAGVCEDGLRRCQIGVIEERLDAVEVNVNGQAPEICDLQEEVTRLGAIYDKLLAATERAVTFAYGRRWQESGRSLGGDCLA